MLYTLRLSLTCLVLLSSVTLYQSLKIPFFRPVTAACIGLSIAASPCLLAQPDVASADSTGKMSTKLTAKKRYLPRISVGVAEFNGVKTSADLDAFVKDALPPFKRAMGLYGASLRKGEIPDEISRAAEDKTEAFAAVLLRASSGNSKDLDAGLASARGALDAYLSFAKLPLSSAPEYAAASSK